MKIKYNIKFNFLFFATLLLLFSACDDLTVENLNDPDESAVLSTGTDLPALLNGAYINFWQAVHDVHPVNALMITSDEFGVSWGNFGGRRMGEEPRVAYNNRPSEPNDYRQVVEDPWFGLYNSIKDANSVIRALDRGVTIDNDGPADNSVRASALFLRGVSYGYLALIFDEAMDVIETTDTDQQLPLVSYTEILERGVSDLEAGISSAGRAGADFSHSFFSGVTMDVDMFVKLSHSYAAKFLVQWPRTVTEAQQTDWAAALAHAEEGIDFDFSPVADGNLWFSYHRFAYADAGQGGFWARIDQRLVAAMDNSQPARYPEVINNDEAPLANPEATSDDARLLSDYIFLEEVDFPVDRGEWHFSHYKNNRNIADPTFAGDGTSAGPMPTFLVADNELLRAEALNNLGRTGEAVAIINAGTRVNRGSLPALADDASSDDIDMAIRYERAIELNATAPFNLWLDRRRWAEREAHTALTPLGGLQLQSPAQLPIPSLELGVQNLDPYNFGGAIDPQGIDRF